MRKITLEVVDALDGDGIFSSPQTYIYEIMPDGSRERIELEIQYVSK